MAITYRPATRFYGLSRPYAFALPLVAALYIAMTVDSAVRHAAGLRSAWKGRAYSTPG